MSLYNYRGKGDDRAVISLTADGISLSIDDYITDKIKNYVDCRYIGAMEGALRIFHCPWHDSHLAVILGVTSFIHLRTVEGVKRVTYKEACSRLSVLDDSDEWR
jgi:hypothetical protein